MDFPSYNLTQIDDLRYLAPLILKQLSMKKISPMILFAAFAFFSNAQTITIGKPEIIPVKLERISPALTDLPETPPAKEVLSGPRTEHDNPSLEHPMQIVNPDAYPKGEDPALQKSYLSP